MSRLNNRMRGANRKRPTPAWQRLAVRFLPIVGLGALLVSCSVWAWQSGLIGDLGRTITAWSGSAQERRGLVLQEVVAQGRERTQTGELARALAVFMDKPILMVDIVAIQKQLQGLPWVRTASVRRQLPNVLLVQLEEYRPLALWQEKTGSPVQLIDEQGTVIGVSGITPFRELPLVFGKGAPQGAAVLLDMIRAEPELAARVTAATRVGERRWDLVMDGRVVVNLPAEEAAPAWHRLARHQRQDRILDRAVDGIDLRVSDRLVLRLMEEPTPAVASKPGRGA